MTDNDDPELEVSEHSTEFTRDGITVSVEIYRIEGGDEGWSLEVVDQENNSTVWDDLFPTDEAAWSEFLKAVEEEGLRIMIGPVDLTH